MLVWLHDLLETVGLYNVLELMLKVKAGRSNEKNTYSRVWKVTKIKNKFTLKQ
jgi:hypothetical protein